MKRLVHKWYGPYGPPMYMWYRDEFGPDHPTRGVTAKLTHQTRMFMQRYRVTLR